MDYPTKPLTKFWDVETDLEDFFILTFYIDPKKVQDLIHPRFKVLTVKDSMGKDQALLSVVPFKDKNFHFKGLSPYKHSFHQTNYRIYVTDSLTGENVVWFLGTMLASSWNLIPAKLWRLPWHQGSVFTDKVDGLFYSETSCPWSSNSFLIDLNKPSNETLTGFSSQEEGLYLLTHPLKGYYYRTDKTLGSYHIWHGELKVKPVTLVSSSFKVLKDLDLGEGDSTHLHSALYLPLTSFTIYLPPKKIL